MKGLLEEIATVMPTLQGWCTYTKAECLVATVLALRPKTIVEIGVFGGASFIPMAMACRKINCGTCYGIDPWSRHDSVEDMDGANKEWWSQCPHEEIYQRFLSRLIELKLNEQVRIIRQRSDACDLNMVIDFLHIDGNHGDTASCIDINRFGAMVRVGGILCFDDIGWAAKAYALFPTLGFEELYRKEGYAFLQKVR